MIESTGFFTDATKAVAHREHGVKKVIISAPAKNEDLTIVLGVNENMYDPAKHHVISNASCTTNGLAPVAESPERQLRHREGPADHGACLHQLAETAGHRRQRDLRDARAAAQNIVPSSTGAARAVGLVIPELRASSAAWRSASRPRPSPSWTSPPCSAGTPPSKKSTPPSKSTPDGPMKGIVEYTELPLVSTDMKGNTHSSIYSAIDTIAVGGNLVKVVAWYDNEWGYSCRVADLVNFVAQKGL